MKKTLLAAAIAAALVSCKKEETPATPEAPAKKAASFIAAVSWLEGRWENNSEEGNLSEIWTKENDSLYKGASYFVIGKDTVFSESADLIQKDGELSYIVSVKGQNGERPVEFKRTSGTETQVTFENPQHDYPSKIVYERVADDSLVATISGNPDGKAKTEVFKMRKVN